MATVKKGTLTAAKQWWVHLRKEWRRDFWHRERRAAKAQIAFGYKEIDEQRALRGLPKLNPDEKR